MKNIKLISVLVLTVLVIFSSYLIINKRLYKAKIKNAEINKEQVEDLDDIDVFSEKQKTDNYSNVVGYISGGAFYTYIPNWMSDNWRIMSLQEDDSIMVITPKDNIKFRDYSDIYIKSYETDEKSNALNLYNLDLSDKTKLGKIINNEIVVNDEYDTRSYNIERENNKQIYFTSYIDGNGKTIKIDFDSSKENYYKYILKIKEFIKGLVNSSDIRG
jgi:hypothetical protein